MADQQQYPLAYINIHNIMNPKHIYAVHYVAEAHGLSRRSLVTSSQPDILYES